MKVGDLVRYNKKGIAHYTAKHANDIGLITKIKEDNGSHFIACRVMWMSTNHNEFEWLEELEVLSASDSPLTPV